MMRKLMLLFFMVGVCVSTSSSQESPKLSVIYSVTSDGVLTWHRHDGAATGTGFEIQGSWIGGKTVGAGWNEYTRVFSGGGDIIYGVKADGTLDWREHKGFASGDDELSPPKSLGQGWDKFAEVFGAGDGVIYAIMPDGTLRWFRHLAYRTGGGIDTPGAWATPRDVGRGWTGYKHVFSGGNGVIYVIANDGTLKWYRHKAYLTGEGLDTPDAWDGPKTVGRGWGGVEEVFSSGDGVIYAINSDGKLWWYRHYGYMEGLGLENSNAWSARKEVGHGWNAQLKVFALLPVNNSQEPEAQTQESAPPVVNRVRDVTAGQTRHGGAQLDRKHANELRCRGGSNLRFHVDEGPISSSNEATSYLTVTFNPASQPAGVSGRTLQPGQCAFIDRTLRADEPAIIFQQVVNFAQLRQQLHGTPVDNSATAAERYPDALNIPRYLSDENHYWSFFVTQSGPLPQGKFVSTASNYWKPFSGVGDTITQPVDKRKARSDRVLSPTKP